MNRVVIDYEFIPDSLHMIGAVLLDNYCCKNKPVLITQTNGKNVFSCQCACGGWCTTGCKSIQDAISAWDEMCKNSNRYKYEHGEIKE